MLWIVTAVGYIAKEPKGRVHNDELRSAHCFLFNLSVAATAEVRSSEPGTTPAAGGVLELHRWMVTVASQISMSVAN
jgi:hypothetical protein